MKCDLCKNEITESFLGKIKGAYIKTGGKRKTVCSDCQRKYKGKMGEQLK
ncbi:MAG: hypothetical protein AABX49_02750 [Nanoarchaeota archaeon]